MLRCIELLWADDCGFVVSAELALVSTLGVLGMVGGLSEASGNVNSELMDVGVAIHQLDQSSSFTKIQGESIGFYEQN